MPSAPRQIRPRLANARDSSRATQCAARVRRKNGTTVVVRCRTPKVSLGHSSRLSPRVNCAEAGATCGSSRSSLFPVSRKSSRRRDGINPRSRVARAERPPRVNGSRAVGLKAHTGRSKRIKIKAGGPFIFAGRVWTAQISAFDRLDGRAIDRLGTSSEDSSVRPGNREPSFPVRLEARGSTEIRAPLGTAPPGGFGG